MSNRGSVLGFIKLLESFKNVLNHLLLIGQPITKGGFHAINSIVPPASDGFYMEEGCASIPMNLPI